MATGSKVLRFAVTGALLTAPMAAGCGEDDISINEPMPEPTLNEGPDLEPAPEPNGPNVPEEDDGTNEISERNGSE
jgi:hypothetical protein